MVFVGVYGEWGRIDVTQADLGCGQDRESIYKTKSPAPADLQRVRLAAPPGPQDPQRV